MDRATGRVRLLTGALIAVVSAILLAPFSGLAAGFVGPASGGRWSAVAVALVLSAAVGLSPWRPAIALGLAWLAAIGQMVAGLSVIPADIAILVVLFAAGASAVRAVRIAGLVSALAGAVVAAGYLGLDLLLSHPESAFPTFVLMLVAAVVTLVLAWTFGFLTATLRRARSDRAEAAALAREAVAEQERGRIARDMHDVVAHSLAVIVAQADGARYLAGTPADRSGETLATVSAVAREALGDVRVLLERLRHRQGELPQPGVADLGALVEQVREAGLEVELRAEAPPEHLPAGIQLAVYRIVQESLTNAIRHGDRARPASVAIAWGEGGARIEVRSALREGAAPGEPGHGLLGIQERARLAGGEARAGAVGGEFLVTARLPFDRSEGGE